MKIFTSAPGSGCAGKSLQFIKALLLFLGLWTASFPAFPAFSGQDTIRIMDYNLLNYGTSSSPASYKNPRLGTIITYTQPDILGASEISANPANLEHIRSQALGEGWEHSNFQNSGNQSLVSALFWRSGKFALQRQVVISRIVRDIVAYRLYYKDPALAETRDTIFLTVILVHLKAGNSPQDALTREAETRSIVSYLNTLDKQDNYIVMGDMNLYSSYEAAYNNLINSTNPASRFHDPINRPGDWSGSAAFSDIHTQSTRRASLPDGGASGGMNDRFDIQLASASVIQNSARVSYITGSYTAFGQDGKRLNKAVNAGNPANTSAPPDIINALYEMSDHLPVYADYVLTPAASAAISSPADLTGTDHEPDILNPFGDRIRLTFRSAGWKGRQTRIRLNNITGKTVLEKEIRINIPAETVEINNCLPPGIYILTVFRDGIPVHREKLHRY